MNQIDESIRRFIDFSSVKKIQGRQRIIQIAND